MTRLEMIALSLFEDTKFMFNFLIFYLNSCFSLAVIHFLSMSQIDWFPQKSLTKTKRECLVEFLRLKFNHFEWNPKSCLNLNWSRLILLLQIKYRLLFVTKACKIHILLFTGISCINEKILRNHLCHSAVKVLGFLWTMSNVKGTIP